MGLRRRIRFRLRSLVERFSGEYSAAADHLAEDRSASSPDPGPSVQRPVRARLVKPRSNPDEDPREGR